MAVTTKDVAKRCGVSVATVSRVINNSSLVSDATREKVNKAIEELGFIPNKCARSLSIKKTNTIGIVIPDISNPFFGEIIVGAAKYGDAKGYDIIISNSGYDSDKIFKDILSLRGRDVEGIILSSPCVNDKILDYLCENEFPFVLTGPVSYSKYPVNYVSINNMEAGKVAVEHLIKLGHKRIAYVSGDTRNYINHLRFEGYKKAMKNNGLEVNENLYFHIDNIHDEIRKMKNMDYEKRPTAMFAFNDNIALTCMEVLERNGIRVPRDMAIVGVDNIRMASYYTIELTTIDNRQIEFGKKAMEILLEKINNKDNRTQQILTKPQLIIRKSCGMRK